MKPLTLFLTVVFLLAGFANTADAESYEYATIRWDGPENTHVVLPSGKVDFLGSQLNAIKRPDRADARAFYMNALMNALAQQGYEFAGMSNDLNTIVMKRRIASPPQMLPPQATPPPPQIPSPSVPR